MKRASTLLFLIASISFSAAYAKKLARVPQSGATEQITNETMRCDFMGEAGAIDGGGMQIAFDLDSAEKRVWLTSENQQKGSPLTDVEYKKAKCMGCFQMLAKMDNYQVIIDVKRVGKDRFATVVAPGRFDEIKAQCPR